MSRFLAQMDLRHTLLIPVTAQMKFQIQLRGRFNESVGRCATLRFNGPGVNKILNDQTKSGLPKSQSQDILLILTEVNFENHLSLHFFLNSRAALDCADKRCDAATAWGECGE